MKKLRFELHSHTAETSRCSLLCGRDLALSYHALGYDGLVVTDHFSAAFFNEQPDLSWPEQVDRYLAGFDNARAAGAPLGLTVLFGLEVRFACSPVNDYLVYGPTREDLIAYPYAYDMGRRAFHQLCQAKGWLMLQAHPFRLPYRGQGAGCYVIDPADLDGIELYNAHPRHDSNNATALAFAQDHPEFVVTRGSDAHEPGELGLTDMTFAAPLETAKDLVAQLRRNYVFRDVGATLTPVSSL